MSTAQTTPNLGLIQPTVGSPNWGLPLNQDLMILDTAIGNLQNGFTGPWSGTTIYSKAQIVTYTGGAYISLANNNIGHSPDTSSAFWSVLAQAGAGSVSLSIPLSFPGPGTQTVVHNLGISNPCVYATNLTGNSTYIVNVLDGNSLSVTSAGAVAMTLNVLGSTVTGAPAVVSNADLASGLVAHWPMNEGSGATFIDSVAGNNMELYGVTWNGKRGSFSASGSGALVTTTKSNGNYPLLSGSVPFSISFGIDLSSVTPNSGSSYTMLANSSSSPGSSGISIQLASSGEINVSFGSTNNTGIVLDSPAGLLSVNVRSIITLTYDGTGKAAGTVLYVNGNRVSISVGLDNLSGSTISSKFLAVMAAPSDSGGSQNLAPGIMDSLYFHSRVLNSSEISLLASQGAN